MITCQIIGLMILGLQCCILFFLYQQGGLQLDESANFPKKIISSYASSSSLSSSFSIASTQEDKMHLKNPEYVPCGDRKLHEVMVNLVDQFETAYLTCLDPILSEEPECEMNAIKPFRAVIRRLHKYTREMNEKFVTVQYGCLDGRSNDPIYGALMKIQPRYSLSNWEGILVEPAFMEKLKNTYQKFAVDYGLPLDQMHYAEGAINTPENIDSKGQCHFYKVVPGGDCPQKKEWFSQISGLSEKGLRGFFKNNFEKCVEDNQIRCWTPAQLLGEHGFNIVRDPVAKPVPFTKGKMSKSFEKNWRYSGSTYCLDKSKPGGLQKIDLLVVDVEGYDGDLVKATLNELCPELWPSVILYEDKVVRYNSGQRHHKSTVEADDIIEFLEDRGYYCMLNGEDVVALRVGYSVKDLVHTTPFEPIKSLTWFHPRRGPLENQSTR